MEADKKNIEDCLRPSKIEAKNDIKRKQDD